MGAAPANVEITVQPWPWQDPAAENVPEDLREAIRKQIGRDDRSMGHQGAVAFVDPSEHPSDQQGPESPLLFLTIYEVPGGSHPYTTEGEDPGLLRAHRGAAGPRAELHGLRRGELRIRRRRGPLGRREAHLAGRARRPLGRRGDRAGRADRPKLGRDRRRGAGQACARVLRLATARTGRQAGSSPAPRLRQYRRANTRRQRVRGSIHRSETTQARRLAPIRGSAPDPLRRRTGRHHRFLRGDPAATRDAAHVAAQLGAPANRAAPRVPSGRGRRRFGR